jgi:hypothetical protein
MDVFCSAQQAVLANYRARAGLLGRVNSVADQIPHSRLGAREQASQRHGAHPRSPILRGARALSRTRASRCARAVSGRQCARAAARESPSTRQRCEAESPRTRARPAGSAARAGSAAGGRAGPELRRPAPGLVRDANVPRHARGCLAMLARAAASPLRRRADRSSICTPSCV